MRYQEILSRRNELPHLLKNVRELLDHARADFEEASQRLSPSEWALLYYSDYLVLDSLNAFGFSANRGLRRLLSSLDAFDLPPADWLGTNQSVDEVIQTLGFKLRSLPEGPSCAAWTALAVAKRLVLNREETAHCRWHSPEWLEQLCKKAVAQ